MTGFRNPNDGSHIKPYIKKHDYTMKEHADDAKELLGGAIILVSTFFPLSIFVVGILGGAYQVFRFINEGVWYNYPVLKLMEIINIASLNAWVAFPKQLIGIHKILAWLDVWMLIFVAPILFLIFLAIVIIISRIIYQSVAALRQ